jgi:peroxiredoxin
MTTHPPSLPTINFDAVGPTVGVRFPDLRLPDQTGAIVDLHVARAGRRALVVFYRSADW